MTLGIKNMPLIAFTYLISNSWLFIIISKATMKTCAAVMTVLSFSVMSQIFTVTDFQNIVLLFK